MRRKPNRFKLKPTVSKVESESHIFEQTKKLRRTRKYEVLVLSIEVGTTFYFILLGWSCYFSCLQVYFFNYSRLYWLEALFIDLWVGFQLELHRFKSWSLFGDLRVGFHLELQQIKSWSLFSAGKKRYQADWRFWSFLHWVGTTEEISSRLKVLELL